VTGSQQVPGRLEEIAHRMPAAIFLRSAGKPIAGDRDLLEHALSFANEGKVACDRDSLGRLHPTHFRFVPWKPADEDDQFMKEWRARNGTTTRDRMPSYGELASERREQLRACLSNFLDEPAKVRQSFVADLSRHLEDVVSKPTWRLSGKGPHSPVMRTDELWPLSWSALLAYVALLLLDGNRKLGADLCRCRLKSCQQFFLAKKPKTGRPRRDYHSDDCMKQAHALDSTKRAQKSRAKARKSK
jgi:hypothetical protein